MAAWTDGRCSNCGAMLTTDGCPFCVRKTLIVTTTGHTEYADPRAAEIARLKAEVKELGDLLLAERTSRNRVMAAKVVAHEQHQKEIAAHKRALAAGPAALREMGFRDYADAATIVEAAQEAAMKGKP